MRLQDFCIPPQLTLISVGAATSLPFTGIRYTPSKRYGIGGLDASLA
jgi:hypothetical protein